ncbi:MAG: YbfB/YjiJ family MFS transporter [Gammaproteobacteria bacterium]|nr:YbfB/YjiJ family MFS transporter [Gammaproteobacteria bacterium]
MLGIARFAYTPLLPLMQTQAGLDANYGAWLASINYFGYLTGALIAASISDMALKDRLYRIGIILAVVTTLAMALMTDWRLWAVARFLAGLSSAAGLLLGSGLILNWLMRHHYRSELGIHFSGVGLGILVSALLVELMSPYFDWQSQWVWLSLIGVALALPAWLWLPPPKNSGFTISGNALEDHPPSQLFLRIFMVAYFCAGAGYVISATFIVAIIEDMPGLSDSGNFVFLIVGLAATPACILWDRFARLSGSFNALIVAALFQTIGIALPLFSATLWSAIASAILFGATFIGIVSLVLTMAGRYYPSHPSKMMGKMTFSYGIAQIAAPAAIAVTIQSDGNYNQGLYLAAGAMVIGTAILVLLRFIEEKHASPNQLG